MADFNSFVQTELPKRPWTEADGNQGDILVRQGLGPRQMAWVPMPQSGFNKLVRLMDAGVLSYTLPALPKGVVMVFVNGVQVGVVVDGVNVTITEYTAGSIEGDDELTIFY